MLTVVTGGSGSGKSAYAEDLLLSYGLGERIYIATMFPFDEESHRRIARHCTFLKRFIMPFRNKITSEYWLHKFKICFFHSHNCCFPLCHIIQYNTASTNRVRHHFSVKRIIMVI